MEVRLTRSVVKAIEFVLKLEKGENLCRHSELTQPHWTGFDFFDKIKSSPVVKIRRIDYKQGAENGGWLLKREIEFYFYGTLVAKIQLRGKKLNPSPDCRKGMTLWGVRKVEYRTWLTGEVLGVKKFGHWKEVDLGDVFLEP